MTNPFDDETRSFHVLINDEHQYSLWPATFDVPSGWTTVLADEPRADCLTYVDQHWVDMRPRSLVEAMNEHDRHTAGLD
jgi:MbtH protein